MINQDRFWIDEKYLDMFDSVSLNNSEYFYKDNIGRLVRSEPEKSIHYFKIDSNGKSLGFYLKKERPSLLSHLKYFLKKKSFYRLNVRHELDLIRLFQGQGISVVEPVALGEKCILGIPIRGFLIQREVVGKEFIDLMKKGTTAERIKLIKAYGKFVAVLHSKGLISAVPRVTDLICASSLGTEWQNINLVVIDREKGPLQLEPYSIEKVGYALSSIVVRFVIYIDVPCTNEVKCFLRSYLKYLEVDQKPSLRNIISVTQKNFDIMMNKYRSHIDPADRILLGV